MSERHDPDTVPEDSASEWSDQERALREERLGLASAETQPRVAQYRLLARISREPAEVALLHDFAAVVAARAEAPGEPVDDRVDLWVQRGLLAVLALTGVAFLGWDVAAWFQQLFVGEAGAADQVRATAAARWVLAIGLCVALSFLIEPWTRPAAPRQTKLESQR